MTRERTDNLRTAIFVDYESWYWGLRNQYGEVPNLEHFREEMKKRGQIDSIEVFADFSKEEMKEEKDRLRLLTSDIFDTSTMDGPQKDFTDFIMLDHIYRKIIDTISKGIQLDQFVIVSGDGHYFDAARCLRDLDKKVGIVGVKGTIKKILKDIAYWVLEIEPEKNDLDSLVPDIFETLRDAESKGLMPGFKKTAEACANYYRHDVKKVEAALSKTIREGYIRQDRVTLDNGQQITVLVPQWDAVDSRGLKKPL